MPRRRYASETQRETFRCTPTHPMPEKVPPADEPRWTHLETETTYEGSMFNVVTCRGCGREWKVSP